MNDSVQSVVQNPRCPMIYSPRCGNRSSRSLRKNPICETSIYFISWRFVTSFTVNYYLSNVIPRIVFLIFSKNEKDDQRSRRKETRIVNIKENLIFRNFFEKKKKKTKQGLIDPSFLEWNISRVTAVMNTALLDSSLILHHQLLMRISSFKFD